jgi:cephalosporin hydroxylase
MRSEEFWAYFEPLRAPLAQRGESFATMFQRLDQLDRPVGIIETGCTRKAGNWGGDGNSTVLFDHYARTHPGSTVLSVDIDPRATELCRSLVSEAVSVHTGDSVKYLHELADVRHPKPEYVDLVYLDSFDFDVNNPDPSALHHLMELTAIAPRLRADTMVVVDDAFVRFLGIVGPNQQLTVTFPPRIDGKARYVAEYAVHVGAEAIFSGYQCGWVGMRAGG